MIPVFRRIPGFCCLAYGGFKGSAKQFKARRTAVNHLPAPMIPHFDSAPY